MTTGLLKTSWQMGQTRCLCSMATAGPPDPPPSCGRLGSGGSAMDFRDTERDIVDEDRFNSPLVGLSG